MAWTEANPVSIGDATKKIHYDNLFDNADYLMDYVKGDNAQGSGATGHPHDGTDGVQIAQAALKTSTSEVSQIGIGTSNAVLTGGMYSFYPQSKYAVGGGSMTVEISTAYQGGAYATNVGLTVNTAGEAYVQSRYVTASGEVHWIFLLRNTDTGKIVSMWQAPDHPCFGNGGDPDVLAQPFTDFDPITGIHSYINSDGDLVSFNAEVIVINPSQSEVVTIGKEAQKDSLGFLELFKRDYDLDETIGVDYPNIEITVALDKDFETGEYKTEKVKVLKPAYIKCYELKKKPG